MGQKTLIPVVFVMVGCIRYKYLLQFFLLLLLGLASRHGQAMDVVLVFTQLQDNTSSLYAATRTRMIIGHLKRFHVDQVAVMVRTRDLNNSRVQERVKAYHDAGYLLVNLGYHQHFLSRPDVYPSQADVLRGHQRLKSFAGYRGHWSPATFEIADEESNRDKTARFARSHGFAPVYVTARMNDNGLNSAYQAVVERRRQVDMGALQDAWVDTLWPALVELHYLHLALGRGPLVVALEEHDLTAYLLPGLLERIQAVGGRFVAPSRYFSYPTVYSPPGNLHQPDAYLAALLQLPPPDRHQVVILGGGKVWTERFLSEHGLMQ